MEVTRREQPEIADLLCEIMRHRRVVEIVSAKDPEGTTRIIEPHAVYIGSNSRGFVDFFQHRGWSKSGGLPGWRRLALTDIVSAEPREETFTPRADYRPENRQWYRAFVCTAEPVDQRLGG